MQDAAVFREMNKALVEKNDSCMKAIQSMKEIENFLGALGFLTFGRDFLYFGDKAFSLQTILVSLELTAGNTVSCCEHGCMADANTLMRKFRDDMLFYLYISAYNALAMTGEGKPLVQTMKEMISNWLSNNMQDLHSGEVMKAIAQLPRVQDAVVNYNLKKSFEDIGKKLNDYVHSNGIAYYNLNYSANSGAGLKEATEDLLFHLRFFAVSFVFLLTFCSPNSIMSTDYVDYFDAGATPPEESLYWVAPFVIDFLKENQDVLDNNCMDYLQANTGMMFDMEP